MSKTVTKRRLTRTVYLNLMKKQLKCYNWKITLYDAKTWTLQKAWRWVLEKYGEDQLDPWDEK
jgi:hypothetical protein